MQFRVTVDSAEYLDDVPHLHYEYKSTDVVDFSEYVQSCLKRVKDLLNFDKDFRDTYQINVSIFIDGTLQATEYFRRSESDGTTITNWRVLHNL